MEKETPPFEFGIIRILDCGFLIEEAVLDEPTMNLGYGMGFFYDVEQNWIQFNIRVDFKQQNSGILFISGTVLTRFNVNNLKGFINESGKLILPENSLEALFGIAFGHMRAIFAKNIAGSRFMHIIVPAINSSVVFKDLLKANIEKIKEVSLASGNPIDTEDGLELFEMKKIQQLANSRLL